MVRLTILEVQAAQLKFEQAYALLSIRAIAMSLVLIDLIITSMETPIFPAK